MSALDDIKDPIERCIHIVAEGGMFYAEVVCNHDYAGEASAELAALRERAQRMESCLLWFRDHYKEDRTEETEALEMLEEALK